VNLCFVQKYCSKKFGEIDSCAVKLNKHNYLSPQMIADTHFYDGANLIGNLGGSLYLFLAISIAHIIVVLRMGGKQLMNKKHL